MQRRKIVKALKRMLLLRLKRTQIARTNYRFLLVVGLYKKILGYDQRHEYWTVIYI